MAHRQSSPSVSPSLRYNKCKQEVRLDRIPFDETSKYLDSIFDGDKEVTLNQQFNKGARDQYKCFCQICLKNNPNLMESSPSKMSKSFYVGQSSNFHLQSTCQSFNHQKLFGQTSTSIGNTAQNQNAEGLAKLNETTQEFNNTIQHNNNNNNLHSQVDSHQNILRNHDTDFNFILKRLVPPQRIQRTLRILVPETVLFWNGEAKLLVYTNYKDNQLKFVKQKEKLQLNEIRKFFNERRSKYRQLVEQKLEEMRIFGPNEARFIKRPQEIRLFDTNNSTPTNKNDNTCKSQKISELTKFSHVKKSKLGEKPKGDSTNNSNTSPVSSFQRQETGKMNSIMKNGMNNQQKRPKTSGNRSSETQSGINQGNTQGQQIIENKDAIVYKLDSFSKYDQDHTTVVNESDFLTLMMKRKHHYFVYEEMKDDELFYRAFKDIQILNGEISSVSSEFVPIDVEEEFETKLMYDQIEEYQKYISCKIFHFLQTFHNVTIQTLETEWLQDDTGTLYLMNCKNINFIQQGRTYITTEMYYKRIEEKAEKKLKLKEGLEEKYKDYRKDTIKLFSDAMMQNYEDKKKKLGILQQKKTREEVDVSDEVFSQIYPEIKFKLSDLLKTNAPIRVLQQEILGEKAQTLRDKNNLHNSQMFSKVYCSPQKSKGFTEVNSMNTTFTMRQTFSLMNRTNPPHRRIFSAQNRKDINTPLRFDSSVKSSKQHETSQMRDHHFGYESQEANAISNLIENSPSIKIVKSFATSDSTTKKWLKVKKKTLPYYLFCSSQ